MEGSGTIRVVPDSISFRDLNKDESDSIEVWACNTSKSPTYIRFSLPRDSPFGLIQNNPNIIPPGLEAKAVITYTAKDDKPLHSELSVSTEDTEVQIPITASPPCPRVVTDKPILNLGDIGVDISFKFSFSLSNIGVKEGNFILRCREENLSIMPTKGTIPPSKSQEVSCTLKPNSHGPIEFTIDVDAPDNIEKPEPIKVTANAVSHSLKLVVNGKDVKELDFQTIFFGQKRVIRAKIVNTGPAKRSFVVMSARDGQEKSSPRSIVSQIDDSDIIFSSSPSEGTLDANESTEISLIFTPPKEKPNIDDIDTVYTQYSTIEVVETGQHMDFSFTGKAVHQYISLSAVDFSFNKSEIGEKQCRKLVVKNESHFLPVEYEIKELAHFRFKPRKGVIPINGSKEISIIFYPKNYGIFDNSSVITFCNGLCHREFNLSAECGQTTKEPFRRKPAWETSENARYTANHPDRRYAYGMEDIKKNMKKRATFDGYITESARRRQVRTAMTNFRNKTQKEAEAYLGLTVGKFTQDDVDEYISKTLRAKQDPLTDSSIGLEPFEGLKAPDPPLRNTPAPLFISNPAKFGLSATADTERTAAHRVRKVQMDDNVLIKKKFKPKPTTPAEINECSRSLTPAQQLMVVASHQALNFGQISVFSTVTKSFTITNNLQQHILVTINYEYDELSQSTPASQVILPKQTAGFDIKFSSRTQHNFMKAIQYTINGHHTYAFNVSAQVVAMDVQLSRQTIEFRFSPDSVSPFIREFVTIHNRSNASADYQWTGSNESFVLSQLNGTIDAQKTENIEITYIPTTHSHDEATLIMNVIGGTSRALKCIGDIGQPKCSLPKKTVNFGLIPIGIQKSQPLKIKNTGDDDAVFTMTHGSMSELSITPMNGRISAHDSTTLMVNYKSIHPQQFDIPVVISIAGAQPIQFNVTGQSELPRVQLNKDSFEFGRLFVGSTSSLEGTIQNVGNIPAILFLDLSNHPDFRLEYSTNLSNGESDKTNSIQLVSNPVFVTKEPNQSISESQMELSGIDTPSDESDESGPGLVYRIFVVEGTSVDFNLVFQPSEVGEHSFELPFTMMNVFSSSSFHLQPIVSGEAIQAPLSLNHSSLDFGVAPIFNKENPHCRPVVRQIIITNDYKTPLTWRVDMSSLGENPAFTAEPSEGMLQVGSFITVHFNFTAREAVPYDEHIPVYVRPEKETEESIVGHVQLTAVGTTSLFRLANRHVVLPIVPLNVRSSFKTFVLNDGFVEATFRVQTSADENHFPVKIAFPEGSQMLHTMMKLPIIISFTYHKPTSFSIQMALLDENGNAATFTVTATTDNSIFTLYPFFRNKFTISSSKGSPINCDAKMCEKLSELTGRFLAADDVLSLKGEPWESSIDPSMITFIIRYLNALSLNSTLSDFPSDFIRNDFALLSELINNLSGGKKMPTDIQQDKGLANTINPLSVSDPISKRLEIARKLLRFIQSFGGTIASVRPEFLLSKQDFLQYMKGKATWMLLGLNHGNTGNISSFDQKTLSEFTSSKSFTTGLLSRMKVYENLYMQLSNEAWMMIIMQLFKIFVVSRVEAEKMNAVPGVADAIKGIQTSAARFAKVDDMLAEIFRSGKSLSSSNIYSTAESGLLKWASIHNVNITGDLQKVVNTFEKMSDSVAFSSLLKAHTDVFHGSLPDSQLDKSQIESNAIELTSAMKSLKLPFCPIASEISDGNCCTIAISLAYLFETLPRFIPTTQVEFVTAIHRVVAKAVNIQNPSKAEVTYKASLIGSNAFSLTTDSVVVAPNSSFDLMVNFAARTVRGQTCRLILNPLRPRYSNTAAQSNSSSPNESSRTPVRAPIFSAPVVINLISSVSMTQPDCSLSIEGNIYQTTSMPITINNLIGTKARVKTYMRVTKIADENGKPEPNQKPISQQIQSLIADPTADPNINSNSKKKDPIHALLRAHKNFIIDQNDIEFADEKSTVQLNLEFVPINLGTFRCLILFIDENAGEFVYEIIGKSVLPQPVDVNASKLKTEANKKSQMTIALDTMNNNLVKALAYSIERQAALSSFVSDRKFKEMTTRRVHEIETLYKANFSTQHFTIISSSQNYFEVPMELTVYKSSLLEGLNKNGDKANRVSNSLPISFKPSKAGDYPLKIVMMSKHDVRIFKLNAVGLASTKELSVEFNTVSGNSVKQDIPVNNPSEDIWNYKITLTGDGSFNAPQRISVKPGKTGLIPVSFTPPKIGQYSAELTVFNLTKETTVIYKINGNAEEPPAEKKLVINCQARTKKTQQVDLKPFLKNGVVNVTTTVPIITFNSTLYFENGVPREPFKFDIMAPRSGLSVGTLTFTDAATKNYIWFVVEIHVDSPLPEQTLNVSTIARKSATVNIPIANPKEKSAKFTVVLSDEDLFGSREFIVPQRSTSNYELVVSPLKAMKRNSSVYFYSDDDGEFWYSLKIDATEAPENTLAPLSSPIGKHASTFILLENPLDKSASIRVENTNPVSFHVMSKVVINLLPREKKRIEIRYIPSTVGVKEEASISFLSQDVGDYIYKLTGSGKPPQPLSPIIVTSPIYQANSALVLFSNPFPYPSRFSASLNTEAEGEIFKFLVKKKMFTLSAYGEEFQIPFTFTPTEIGQFSANIVIAYLGPARGPPPDIEHMPGVRWVYPVIGNSINVRTTEVKHIKCRSMDTTDIELPFVLVGETEVFDASEYSIHLLLPPNADFLRYCVDLKATSIKRTATSSDIVVAAKLSPQRPVSANGSISIKNPLGQEWVFDVSIDVERGKPVKTIVIESLLNKTGTAAVEVPSIFRIQTPFHAYLANGSAAEFTVSPAHGFIDPTITGESTTLPIQLVFAPKMYGKVLQGLLVVDTLDAQYLFDIVGKTPEYIPPMIRVGSRLGTLTEEEIQRSNELIHKKRRNIIKDNIESVKLTKPKIIAPNRSSLR